MQMLCMFRRKSDNFDFCQFYGFKPTTNMCRLSYTPPQCSTDPRDKKGTWETWVLADTDWTKQCIDSWENPYLEAVENLTNLELRGKPNIFMVWKWSDDGDLYIYE